MFHDDLDLKKVRLRLAYYPRDVWLYLMLAGWWQVHPEMNLVGRAGYAGDDLGSTLIAGKIVSGLMHLSFLIERRYAPYVKWFGTAFSELQIADRLSAPLDNALHARSWREPEKALGSHQSSWPALDQVAMSTGMGGSTTRRSAPEICSKLRRSISD